MQLRYLRTFVAVASTLNFTRAAEQVHLAQSSVTEQIQSLEADLGAILFDRSGRKLRLTEAGHRLLQYAERLLALGREARVAVADAATAGSPLALGALETLSARWLSGPLERLMKERPGLPLRVEVGGTGDLLARVRRGELDACLVWDAEPEVALSSAIADTADLVVIAPAQHRWKQQKAVAPNDLAGEPFFVTPKGCVYRRIFDQAMADLGEAPNIIGEFESVATLGAMVARGGGCALMPRLAAPLRNRHIIVRPWHGKKRSAAIHLVWRQQAVQPPALRILLAVLTDRQLSHEPVAAVDV
ncbi:LysR family transcriptional regulator [Dyella kyungheensis]|uniref:LysR family transcriptional regulator n=1 Tax=Dyella kyungheensis TaxID=1242174 RepID=UPI003CE9B879